MDVLVKGHKYLLDNFEHIEDYGQELQFIHKEKVGDDLMTLTDGTTNEEVLWVLIDRMNHLQKQFPCQENLSSINHMKEALRWLNKRTEYRNKRGVEGKHEK